MLHTDLDYIIKNKIHFFSKFFLIKKNYDAMNPYKEHVTSAFKKLV
jgi:hypothetical protein